MIAIEKTNNTGKFLVAVLALFIAIAGAAVVLSDNSVDATAPTVDFSGATTVPVDGIEDFGATNGTVTVEKTTV